MNVSPALNNLRNFAKQFQGVLDLIPELEEVQSLENNIRELRLQLTSLEEQKSSILSDMEDAKNEIEIVKEEVDRSIASASENAKEIIERGIKTVNEYEEKSKERLSKAQEDHNKHSEKLSIFITEQENKLADLMFKSDAKEKEYNDLVDNINKLKAKF
jgi:chromosome segregation ATPase